MVQLDISLGLMYHMPYDICHHFLVSCVVIFPHQQNGAAMKPQRMLQPTTTTTRQYHLIKPGDGVQCICGRKFTVPSLNQHIIQCWQSCDAATSPPAPAKKGVAAVQETAVARSNQGVQDIDAEEEEGVTQYVDLFQQCSDTAALSPKKEGTSFEEWEAWWVDGKGMRKRPIPEVNEGSKDMIAYVKASHAKARASWNIERERLCADLRKERNRSLPMKPVKIWPVSHCTST
jgi:hypothetical protein